MILKAEEALDLLKELIRISNSTLPIEERLNAILEKLHSCFSFRGIALYVLATDRGIFELKTSKGLNAKETFELAEVSHLFGFKEEPVYLYNDQPEAQTFLNSITRDLSVDKGVLFPVIDDKFMYGAFIVAMHAYDSFDKEELELLVPVSQEIAGTIRNAQLYSNSKLMLSELSRLFELNKAVMATIDLDKLLNIILTAVTIGEGFGFNRAMLFLYNEKTGYIQGMLGVGPDNTEDAWKIWSGIIESKKTLQDILMENSFKTSFTRLNETVKGIRVSINDKSVIGLTVKEKKPFNIKDAWHDPRVSSELRSRLDCQAFATVPLIASGRVVGLILVDNIFNRKPITKEDVRLLTVFANQAAVAIENSILYRNLKDALSDLKEAQNKLLHSEKLAALGEMAAGVAHEIRNPLVSIGGFARRLSRQVQDSDDVKYVDIICKEVNRLENILNDILIFSREESVELELQDINRVIEDTLLFFSNDYENCNIQLSRDLQAGIGMIEANYHQLKQVFINIFSNAKHAMEDGGQLTVRTYQHEYKGKLYATVEISDTGGGIAHDIMQNIFNPFFTTKNSGTGLGLAITHKILSTYGGTIDVVNNDSGGATFIITIPTTNYNVPTF